MLWTALQENAVVLPAVLAAVVAAVHFFAAPVMASQLLFDPVRFAPGQDFSGYMQNFVIATAWFQTGLAALYFDSSKIDWVLWFVVDAAAAAVVVAEASVASTAEPEILPSFGKHSMEEYFVIPAVAQYPAVE